MPARKPRPPDEKPQFERFLDLAREVGAAETDEGLDEVAKRVITSATPRHSESRSAKVPKKSQV
jgi:hypothetical protein